MMNRINVGFIGLGRIADLHAKFYENHETAAIYAVCDTEEELLRQRKHEWKAEKAFVDYREMLCDPDLDAVEILSPHPLHESMTLDAVKANKHIALQKPMTTSLESARRMIEALSGFEKVFKVTDNYLFYPPILLARKMIESGEIGEPTAIRIKMVSGAKGGWQVPDSAWEWRLEESIRGRGFQTFDHGHHLWAVSCFLLGRVERVCAWIDSADGVVDCPAVVMWKYRDKPCYGTCEYTFGAGIEIPSKYYANDEWIEVTGSQGIVIIRKCTGNLVEGPAVSLYRKSRWRHFDDVPDDWAEGFVGAAQNFIDAVRGDQSPILSATAACEVLNMSLAIARSSRERREISLDEMHDV
jgi:predicted dehydrogenase